MKRKTRTRLSGAAGALLLALLIAIVGPFEGLRLNAYKDIAGVPTICYGETLGVKMGQKKTPEQCDIMLGERLEEFAAGVERCIVDVDRIPDQTYISFVSITYNIGVGGFCGSTIVKRANAGNLAGACDAMLMWNKARVKGKLQVVRGLSIRREKEREICLAGVRGVPLPDGRPELVAANDNCALPVLGYCLWRSAA